MRGRLRVRRRRRVQQPAHDDRARRAELGRLGPLHRAAEPGLRCVVAGGPGRDGRGERGGDDRQAAAGPLSRPRRQLGVAGAPADGAVASRSRTSTRARRRSPPRGPAAERDAWGAEAEARSRSAAATSCSPTPRVKNLAYMGVVVARLRERLQRLRRLHRASRGTATTDTYSDPLAQNVNQPGAAEGPGFRHQTYEPVPIGYAISPQDDDSQLSSSPVWAVDQVEWERLGGRTAGTTTADEVTLGELPARQGRRPRRRRARCRCRPSSTTTRSGSRTTRSPTAATRCSRTRSSGSGRCPTSTVAAADISFATLKEPDDDHRDRAQRRRRAGDRRPGALHRQRRADRIACRRSRRSRPAAPARPPSSGSMKKLKGDRTDRRHRRPGRRDRRVERDEQQRLARRDGQGQQGAERRLPGSRRTALAGQLVGLRLDELRRQRGERRGPAGRGRRPRSRSRRDASYDLALDVAGSGSGGRPAALVARRGARVGATRRRR